MGLFNNERGPIFLKEDTSAERELVELKALLPRVCDDDRTRLERDIRIAQAGIRGEDQVTFELKNSHLPIYMIHDLRLEFEGLSTQIDFLVICPYVNVIIECKNLLGNITVDDKGQFVREFGTGRFRKRESIYSPITQNERHLQLMRQIRASEKGTVGRLAYELCFDDINKSVVVLANDETVLSDRYAKREVKDKIIRRDALIGRLQQLNAEGKKKNSKASDKDMQQIGQIWLDHHVERTRDVTAGYELRDEVPQASVATTAPVPSTSADTGVPLCPICGAPMMRRVAHRGPREGLPFWGCSNYPTCHGIVNIDG
jgi:hypothetical protein